MATSSPERGRLWVGDRSCDGIQAEPYGVSRGQGDVGAVLALSGRLTVGFQVGGREWRNRQTRTVQVRVSARTWGFNSPLAHHTTGTLTRVSESPLLITN